MMKTIQDINVIDRIGCFYTETKTELSGPISPGMVYDKN